MKKIIVASKNPVKVNATLIAFEKMFPEELFEAEGVEVSSDISDQPMSHDETLNGALNRIRNAKQQNPEAHYFVGIESGIEHQNNEMGDVTWAVIESKEGKTGKGKSSMYFLPEKIRQHIRNGIELGKADDLVFGRTNSKQGNGMIGYLTRDALTRVDYTVNALLCALIPFKNPDLY